MRLSRRSSWLVRFEHISWHRRHGVTVARKLDDRDRRASRPQGGGLVAPGPCPLPRAVHQHERFGRERLATNESGAAHPACQRLPSRVLRSASFVPGRESFHEPECDALPDPRQRGQSVEPASSPDVDYGASQLFDGASRPRKPARSEDVALFVAPNGELAQRSHQLRILGAWGHGYSNARWGTTLAEQAPCPALMTLVQSFVSFPSAHALRPLRLRAQTLRSVGLQGSVNCNPVPGAVRNRRRLCAPDPLRLLLT